MNDQNIFAVVLDKVRAANNALVAEGALPAAIDQSRIVVEPPREAAHGDMATNAAMVLAKDAGKKPRELAEAIAAKLRADDLVAKAEVAGPGSSISRLSPAAWVGALRAILSRALTMVAARRGRAAPSMSNTSPPIRPGRCMSAIAAAPCSVTRLPICWLSAATTSRASTMSTMRAPRSMRSHARHSCATGRRWAKTSARSRKAFIPATISSRWGRHLRPEYGRALTDKPEAEWLPIVRDRAIEMMMAGIRDDLKSLNVVQDVFFSERSLIEGARDDVGETIAALRRAGYVYEGRLPPPKGAPIEDWEDREQTLFRATDFGDDVDRPLMKSDGSYTYFASDIAYHKTKVDRGFTTLIDVWGADHGGYIKRVQAAVKAVQAITNAAVAQLDVKIVQLVKLLRGGEPVKMSKRAGEFVTLREVVDEVGKDAVRFMMLYRKNDAVLDFDLAKVIEQSRDNPVFYVQYGHARGRSVFRNAREVVPDLPNEGRRGRQPLATAPLDRLDDAGELALMRRLALYPRLVEAAALAHEPHRIAFYLYELASDFHAQWNRGKDSPHLRFIIQNDPQMTMARLALVQGVVTVLASGLGVLGVEAPEEMR